MGARKRKASKRALPATKKRWGRDANPDLVLPKFEKLPDGAHAVTMPIHTRPFSNGSQGWSRAAGFAIADEKSEQRKKVAANLFGIGTSFRGVTLVRLSPRTLDTGNLWNALKCVQDEVAVHLGIDDGPNSPASWRMEQERNPAYGVRVELRMQREPSWHDLRAEVATLFAELQSTRAQLQAANDRLARFGEVG